MDLVATFYSHFGAIKFKKNLDALGTEARIAPVPRALSSSCGVCVIYTADKALPMGDIPADVPSEVESIAEKHSDKYSILFKAEES